MNASPIQALLRFGDTYERQARLYPALLALLPAIVLVLSLYPGRLSVSNTLVWVLVACGGLFLLAELARRYGKAGEKALWQKWGGSPSTQVLRHRDSTFDKVSKARLHAACAKLVGADFPDGQQELASPEHADDLYAAACNRLRESTRDRDKYPVLFKDLVSYGFRRNGHGLRVIGIAICLGVLAWVALRHGWSVWATRLQAAPNAELFFKGEELIVIANSVVMLLMWTFFFSEKSVREAAFTYARSLVITSEAVAK